jgi:histo-blood group ABO system transferase
MQTALVVIATGEIYRKYAKKLITSAKQFFIPHDVVLFTDDLNDFDTPIIKIERYHWGYPRATLTRYHAICGAVDILSKYDYIFYSDADMLFVAPVTEDEIFSDGITATEHPGYVGLQGEPDSNPRSTAYLPEVRTYFCGGFNGGTSNAFLKMAEEIKIAVDVNDARGVLAKWQDESHLNKYLYDHPPARILSPSFCFPQGEWEHRGGFYGGIWKAARGEDYKVEPKLIALEKGSRI